MTKLRTMPVTVWAVLALFFSATACGREDSLFSGFSLVIVIIIGILIVRHFAKKNGG